MLADLVGWRLDTPPPDLLGTFLTPGQPAALLAWLAQAQRHVDASLVSFDMLLSGGLVASRTLDRPNDVPVEDALAVVRQGPACYANSVLMRVAPTATQDSDVGLTRRLHEYSRLRAEGESGDAVARQLPPGFLDRYLVTRQRNHAINRRLLEAAAAGWLQYLLVGMDDSKTVGLNVVERRSLEPLLSARSAICPGTDELAHLLLARMTGMRPRMHVTWSHPQGRLAAPLYEDRSFADLVAAHVAVIDGRITEHASEADIRLFVNCLSGGQKEAAEQLGLVRRDRTLQRFVQAVADAVGEGACVAVADLAYANGGDLALARLLPQVVPIPSLDAFSAWNTAGNALGTALAAATLRLCWKRTGAAQATPAEREAREGAHVRFLLNRWLDDVVYQARVRQEARVKMVPLGVSAFNLGDAWHGVEARVARRMTDEAHKVFDQAFRGRTVGGVRIGGDLAVRARLPWPRLFEIDLDCDAGVKALG